MVRGQLTFRSIFGVNTTSEALVIIFLAERLPFFKGVTASVAQFVSSPLLMLCQNLFWVVLFPPANSLLYFVLVFDVVSSLCHQDSFSVFYVLMVFFTFFFHFLLMIIEISSIYLLDNFWFVFSVLIGMRLGLGLIVLIPILFSIYLADLATRIKAIGATFVWIKFRAWFPFLALRTLFEVVHFTYQNKERPWLLLPVLSRTKQRQRRSNSMIAKYSFSGNYLVRDRDIIPDLG